MHVYVFVHSYVSSLGICYHSISMKILIMFMGQNQGHLICIKAITQVCFFEIESLRMIFLYGPKAWEIAQLFRRAKLTVVILVCFLLNCLWKPLGVTLGLTGNNSLGLAMTILSCP